jgi:hypothetical protein
VYATSNPTTTVASDWKATTFSNPVQGVSCPPATTLCVAYQNQTSSGTSAAVIASSSPTAATPGWTTPSTIDSGHTIGGLSCSSASLCVAVDNGGNALTSSNPAGGAPAWSAATVVGGNNALSAVSCVAGPFCVATTFTATPSEFWTSFAPAAGASAWARANTAVAIYGVSCPDTAFCAAVDDIGDVLTSTTASSNSPSWSVTRATGATLLDVSCPTSTLCVATDSSGDVVTATNPAGGPSAWTTTNVDGSEAIFGVSCPTVAFCAAVDDAGDVLTSANPTGGAGARTVVNIDGNAFVNGISCPTASFCVAVDDSGNALVSTNPTGGAGAWQGRSVDSSHSLQAISCVSIALCVAVDDAGNAVTSTAPATGATWSIATVDNAAMNSVSCPSTQMCVAVDSTGYEINSINPAGGASEWTFGPVFGAPIWGISCPSAAGCEVVDGSGQARWGAPTPSNLTLPSITGTPMQGVALTEQHGTWTDSPTSFQVQWERCDAAGAHCAGIANATAQQYVPVAADVGSTIRVLELASNVHGDGVVVESAATVAVAPVPKLTAPVNSALPRITGAAKVGATLTCSAGSWTGSAPITYGYQWLRGGAPIFMATRSSYTTVKADATRAIVCQVKATNAAGAAVANSAIIKIAALPACYGLTGASLANCKALQSERSALARCAAITTKTASGRKRRAACVASAKLTYKRAIAVIACGRITNAGKRAACIAAARKIRK